MNKTHVKEIALIGLPGSGKSTFTSKLERILDIPVHHLDRHMFEPDGKKELELKSLDRNTLKLNFLFSEVKKTPILF